MMAFLIPHNNDPHMQALYPAIQSFPPQPPNPPTLGCGQSDIQRRYDPKLVIFHAFGSYSLHEISPSLFSLARTSSLPTLTLPPSRSYPAQHRRDENPTGTYFHIHHFHHSSFMTDELHRERRADVGISGQLELYALIARVFLVQMEHDFSNQRTPLISAQLARWRVVRNQHRRQGGGVMIGTLLESSGYLARTGRLPLIAVLYRV